MSSFRPDCPLRSSVLFLALLAAIGLGAPPARAAQPADEITPEPGEVRLNAAETEAALTAIGAAFAQAPGLRATITAEVEDDLLGTRKETGELALRRPDRMLRRFGEKGKATKAWTLDGPTVREYQPSSKQVLVKDFTAAPRALALVRAGLTMDVKVLREYFAFTVLKRPGAKEGAPAEYRFVLTPLPEKKLNLPWGRLQARWREGAPFPVEVDYQPRAGHANRVLEKYTDLRVEKDLKDQCFAEPLLDQAPQKVEKVGELTAK